MLIFWIFSIHALQTALVSASKSCHAVDASITQKIEKEGFHRDIRWTIDVKGLGHTNSQCKTSLRLDVPPTLYVNPDEIEELRRMHLLNATVQSPDGIVNIEAMAHESKEHTVYIYLANRDVLEDIRLPIHLRYQLARSGGGYTNVELPKPSFLINCTGKNACGNRLKVSAPCEVGGTANCLWMNISYNSDFDRARFLVPVGNIDDYPVVALVTLLLSCASCFYVLSVMCQKCS